MKINNGHGVQLSRLYQRQLEDKQVEKNTQEEMPAGDSFAISEEAVKMQELLAAAAQSADVRSERVQELKDAIDKGEYALDSKKIAEAMLSKE